MYLLMAISVLALALMWAAVRGRAAQVKDPRSAGEILLAVDLESFRNLIDPTQDRFLRQRLSRRDFRRVQRARVLAIAGYLRKVAQNASVMLRLGEAARDSNDPALSAMGAELVSRAIDVRLNCLLALAQAYIGVLYPGLGISIASVADRYDRLAGTLRSIGRTWTPAPDAAL
jgi:hypothetical protein